MRVTEIPAAAEGTGTDPALVAAVKRLHGAIEARADELTALVADLVRYPSVLGDEAECQHFVTDYLRDAGWAAESWDIDESLKALPNAGDSGVPFVGRPNVAAVRSGAGGGRSLILNGHIDVVSAEPVAAWTRDPWAAEIVDGMMYGRGANDMKSGVAINLFLARLLHELDIKLGGDLIVQSVIEEECTGNGALDMAQRYRADAAVITEPTKQKFSHANMGVMWLKVAVEGKAAHAAVAREGVNAIVKMMPIIQALRELDEELNQDTHPLWEGVKYPINLNIGVIQGGDWPSSVPGACELHCRVSFFPGVTVERMRERIEGAVAKVADGDAWLREHRPTVSYDGFQTAGSSVDVREPSVQLLAAWHERITGTPMMGNLVNAVTDQRYYNFVGIPCGCYGAHGDNSHAADEWLDVASLVPTAKALGGFVLEWCGV